MHVVTTKTEFARGEEQLLQNLALGSIARSHFAHVVGLGGLWGGLLTLADGLGGGLLTFAGGLGGGLLTLAGGRSGAKRLS